MPECVAAQCVDKEGQGHYLVIVNSRVKDILTCTCVAAQCVDKEGQGHLLQQSLG